MADSDEVTYVGSDAGDGLSKPESKDPYQTKPIGNTSKLSVDRKAKFSAMKRRMAGALKDKD